MKGCVLAPQTFYERIFFCCSVLLFGLFWFSGYYFSPASQPASARERERVGSAILFLSRALRSSSPPSHHFSLFFFPGDVKSHALFLSLCGSIHRLALLFGLTHTYSEREKLFFARHFAAASSLHCPESVRSYTHGLTRQFVTYLLLFKSSLSRKMKLCALSLINTACTHACKRRGKKNLLLQRDVFLLFSSTPRS